MPRLAIINSSRKLQFLVLSLFFLALTLLMFRNIFHGAYLTGTDSMSTVLWPSMQAAGGAFFSAWDHFISAGVLSYQTPAYAASNELIIGMLHMPASDYAKLQLAGSFWLAGMISFYVLRAMTGSDKGAFLGSLVYLANGAFVNQIVEGHLGFVTAYPFLILIFYLFHDAYVNGISKKTIALPALLLLYGGFAAPHMVLLAAIMLIGFAVLDMICGALLHQRGRAAYKAGLTAFFAVLLILPMAYMMLALGGSSVYETSYTLEQAFNGSNTFLGAITIGGAELTNVYAFYGQAGGSLLVGMAQLLALPLFFFALLSLFVERCRKFTVPLWLLMIFNIFMSMGPRSPLDLAFNFMFDHVPLVDSFRALSRFALLNAVFYSILIAITVANWGEVSAEAGRLNTALTKRLSRGVKRVRGPSSEFGGALAAVLIISSLSGSIVLANGNVVKAFDVPDEYAEPFEYIEAADDGPYYKIYTLPMAADYYQHPVIPSTSGYGYPKGATLDPGTYLPAVINERGMSNSVAAPDYWSGMRTLVEDRCFGYQGTLRLLGSSAAVKYVVDQWYAPDAESAYFSSMSGGTVVAAYPSGAKVIQVDSYSEPVKAQGGLIVGSGGLENMYLLLGAGVFDPAEGSYAALQWIDENDLDAVLGASDLIVIENGDLTEVAYGLGYLDGALLDLADKVNRHRGDLKAQWVRAVDSGSEEVGVTTWGENDLTLHPNKDVGNGSKVLIRALFGPEQGTLNVTINGQVREEIDTYAPFTGAEWVSIAVPEGIERIGSIAFTGSKGEHAVQVYDAAVLTGEEEEALISQISELLAPYRYKVGYTYTSLNIYLHDASAQLGNWTLGNGVRSAEERIGVTLSTVFDNDLTLSVHAPDWGARDVTLDGNAVAGEWDPSGAYRYRLGALGTGAHDLQVFPDGLYALTLLPEYASGKAAPAISFECISPTEWRVSVTNASGPFILKFSEGTSEFWELRSDGAVTNWLRSDYLANAFIVNGTGDLEMTLVFSKQAAYESFLHLYVFAIFASTGFVAAMYAYARSGVQSGKERLPDAKREQ